MNATKTHLQHLVLLPANRVWRSYPGGATLDRISQADDPDDSHFSEDWIGSVTAAVNPGREDVTEGVSQVTLDGESVDFAQLLASDPEYYLGAPHTVRHGITTMLLVKFLDSAIRLHFQCHPSREFAARILQSPSGKTEAYHVLAIREGIEAPYIYVGFQRPPTSSELERIVAQQDMAALEACFDKIIVKPGDTFLIPGGIPHALGEGIFMVEIQEPTDFAVRFEHERAGYVLPESARYMGRDIAFGISMVDRTAYSLADIDAKFRCAGESLPADAAGPRIERLIGPDQTPCFRVSRLQVTEECSYKTNTFGIYIVTAGKVAVETDDERVELNTFEKFFYPAGLPDVTLRPVHGPAQILECLPPL